MSKTGSKVFPAMLLALLALTLMAAPAFAGGARGPINPQILGPEVQSKQISVSFWLNQHNKAEFDELVRQMYDKNSPNFHHWIKMDEYKAKFAPTAADLAVVRQHLATYNLKEVHADQFNHFITARGSVADVQRATGVQLNRVMINGELHRRAESKIAIPGAAAKVVYAVVGLNDISFKNYVAFRGMGQGQKPQGIPIGHIGPANKYLNANCLGVTQSKTFKTDKLSPSATYKGTRYGNNPDSGPPNFAPCGYNAVQIDKAYGLTSLFKSKLDGTGQTVVIVDAYGSDSITSDANTFAEINGLPALTPSNFSIAYPEGPASCPGGSCSNWNVETSLDVEWAHAVAPGAKIALLLSPDSSLGNLLSSVMYAIENNLGAAISNSYGVAEVEVDGGSLDVINNAYQVGSAAGISVNISSGDDGDFSYKIGEASASSPASSPSATSVGGTSLFIHSDHSIKLQTGWGTNATLIDAGGPVLPPVTYGFQYGAGGGGSYYFAKPSYQSSLTGTVRQQPDISYLADPQTPVELVLEDGLYTVGGTSLACPMFSAMWAIAAQAVGSYPGQASALLYSLPADAIADIPAVTGPNNVTGVVRTPKQPNVTYLADSLAQPLFDTTQYMSTLYNEEDGVWFVVTFGTDTSLMTATGWDNVTGLGTPNGPNFVSDVVAAVGLP